jgi:excisionase family DNA binding protein
MTAASFLNVNHATVYRLVILGHLKVLRSFGRLRISRQQLERFLSQTEAYTPRRRKRT